MTGIERLRELTRKRSTIAVPLVDGTYQSGYTDAVADMCRQLDDIADQIEREARAPFSRMRVLSVISEMERLLSGHEVRGNNPTSRWMRELRDALGEARDPAEDVSMSAYDLLPEEERDAIAWVRDHGGLADVRRHWTLGVEASTSCGVEVTDDASLTSCLQVLGCLTEYDVPLAHAVVAELWPGGRPDECDNDRVMGELRRRLVPEGMEWLVEAWPRFEGGEPVRFGEEAIGFSHKLPFVVDHVVLFDGGDATVCAEANYDTGRAENFVRLLPGERVKRPAPKVLDADGAEIRARDHVWHVETGQEYVVVSICYEDGIVVIRAGDKTSEHEQCAPSLLTHRAPVLAADGRPLREGETVWVTMDNPHDAPLDKGDEVTVKFVPQKTIAHVEDKVGSVWYVGPDDLTHERPDSWERLEEDAESLRQTIAAQLGDYDFDEFGKDSVQTRLMALVRRAKALAGDA